MTTLQTPGRSGSPAIQAAVDSLNLETGHAYALRFYQSVVAHDRRAITMIDGYLPKAARAEVRAVAEQMKRDQLAEITENERKAGAH
jgi:uncharacterized protein (DUF305 family)